VPIDRMKGILIKFLKAFGDSKAPAYKYVMYSTYI
jgi:hypothetical protein